MTQANHTIRIFPKHYVGFTDSQYDGDVVPFAFMTHYEDNAAGRKRQAQVDSWSRGKMNSTIIDNTPMIGFRVSRGLRRLGWTHHATSVRIEDPRGFEVDISVSNMMMLTDNNLLENGEILRECVWGRDGGMNVLLPVNSSPYLAATVNTERMASTVNSRSVALGDTVLLKNGQQGRYLGSMYPWRSTQSGSAYRQPYTITCEQHDKKYHMVQVPLDNGAFHYYGYASLGASSVISSDPLTVQEVNEMMAEAVSKTSAITIPKIYSPKIFTSHPATITSVEMQELDIEERKQNIQSGKFSVRYGYFYGKNKITGRTYRFPDDNLQVQLQGQRYISGLGYVSGSEIYGEEITINKESLTFTRSEDKMDIDDCEYFMLKYNLKIDKIDMELSIVG
jgi:hypothetical protein